MGPLTFCFSEFEAEILDVERWTVHETKAIEKRYVV